MSRLFRYGSLVWTASGAGWLVLGVVTDVVMAYVVGLGCIAMSALFLELGRTQAETERSRGGDIE